MRSMRKMLLKVLKQVCLKINWGVYMVSKERFEERMGTLESWIRQSGEIGYLQTEFGQGIGKEITKEQADKCINLIQGFKNQINQREAYKHISEKDLKEIEKYIKEAINAIIKGETDKAVEFMTKAQKITMKAYI